MKDITKKKITICLGGLLSSGVLMGCGKQEKINTEPKIAYVESKLTQNGNGNWKLYEKIVKVN